MRLLKNRIAQGDVVENTTTETVLDSYSFDADYFQVGKLFHLRMGVKVLDQNASDTLTIKGRLGNTTLTGTAWWTSGAVDVADNDIAVVDVLLAVRALSTTAGTVQVAGHASDPDAAGISMGAQMATVNNLDTSSAVLLEVTATWSAAHQDNQVAAEFFTLRELY